MMILELKESLKEKNITIEEMKGEISRLKDMQSQLTNKMTEAS